MLEEQDSKTLESLFQIKKKDQRNIITGLYFQWNPQQSTSQTINEPNLTRISQIHSDN